MQLNGIVDSLFLTGYASFLEEILQLLSFHLSAPSQLPTDIHSLRAFMKQILIVTDGACIGNPGPGGWACILRYKEHSRELSGSEPGTTNNRMELRAVIEGLRALKEPCQVVVRTDSQYLRDGITKWIHRWKQEGWRHKIGGASRKEEVKNRDLWEEIHRGDVGIFVFYSLRTYLNKYPLRVHNCTD